MTVFGRSAVEQREFEKVRYSGTNVLINKLDFRDERLLEQAERTFVAKRLQKGLPKSAKRISTDGLMAIHRHLFQDLYDWAGKERRYTTGRGPAPFARPEFIRSELEKLFAQLRIENGLKRLEPRAFADRAAFYVNEINAIHPFIEGNGRTQRVWLRNLAEQAGCKIAIRSEDRQRWYDASRMGFLGSHEPMAALIFGRLQT